MKLSQICELRNGKQTTIKNIGKYPIIGSTGIIGRTDTFLTDEPVIAIARVGANCGYVQLVMNKSWITDNTIICKPTAEYDAKYIYYLLSTIDINALCTGAAQPLITISILNNIDVKPHSVSQRQHIVDTMPLFHFLFQNLFNLIF